MGINTNGLRFLLYAKRAGADFSRTAMIGRQSLNLSFNEFRRVIKKEFGHDLEDKKLEEIYEDRYAEGLLRYLGAAEVHSFDYSGYEKATHLHDFNVPIPEKHHGQYTALIEGGSLEHVFNFPVAIRNCMQMIAVGGHYLGITPANNYMGHGFYQFSPELYFRIFSPENGYRIEQILLHEGVETRKWFKVSDPQRVKRRVGFANWRPTLMLVLAARQDDIAIFSQPPLQSDYVPVWTPSDTALRNKIRKRRSWLLLRMSKSIKSFAMTVLGWRRSKQLFHPFDPVQH